MGLFSSKTVTVIDSSSSLLLEETPNLAKDSIVSSVLNNRNIADDLTASYMDSLYAKGRQVRRYAENTYTFGLPNGTLNFITPNDDLIRIILKQITGSNVFIASNVVERANPLRFGVEYLITQRGYDEDTEVVSNPPFTPVNAISNVILTHTTFTADDELTFEYQYESQESGNSPITVVTETETLVITPVAVGELYYHVTYYTVDTRGNATGERQYWFYSPSEGQYPVLDMPLREEEGSRYYPIVPVRRNNQDMTREEVRDTEQYKTSKRLLNFWNINFAELGEGVHASPDIDDVDHAYFMVGVNITGATDAELVYLHEYFGYLAGRSKFTQADFLYWQANNPTSPPPMNTVTIQDDNYRMDLNYTYITTEIQEGNVGELGEVVKTVELLPRYQSQTDGFGTGFGFEQSVMRLTRQVTPNFIETITIHGLFHINYVYARDTVETTLRDAFTAHEDDEKNNFLIPLNVDVVDNMHTKHATAIFYYAIRIVFNTKIKYKLKWYQSGFFQFFTMVVAIVLAAYGGYQFSLAIMEAAAIGVVAVAQVVIQAALISIASTYAVEFLVDAVGLEAAFAIILVISAISFGSGNAEIGSLMSYQLPNAIDMLQITGALLSAYDGVVNDELEDVLKESEEFKEYAQTLWDELEALDTNQGVTALSREVISSTMGPYETPEEFLARTTYSDNIGVLSLETIETFVDRMLKLDIPTNEIRTQL